MPHPPTVRPPGRTLLLLCGLLTASCAHRDDPAPAATEAPSGGASTGREAPAGAGDDDHPPDRAHHMQETFWLAVDARDALIAGDLETAKRHADALANYDYGDHFPDDWRHWVKDMQRHAGDVGLAGSLREAAGSLAELGLSCANCHWHVRRGPDQPRDPALPWEDPPDDVGARMFRHEVGADQMWMGMIDPSEEAWRNGTITLTRAPLVAPQREGEPVDERTHAQIERIRDIARRARAAGSHQERAVIYADLITTCADCHRVATPSEP